MTDSIQRQKGILLGATGLVGSALLPSMLNHSLLEQITTLTRKPPRIPTHPRLHSILMDDFEKLKTWTCPPNLDFAISCFGTTLKQAGSPDSFQRIDEGYNLEFAKKARAARVQRFILLSAAGADPTSSILYNRVKGRIEQAIQEMGFPRVVILRPGLLVGDRTEHRSLERIAIEVTRGLGKIIGPKHLARFATPVESLVSRLLIEALEPSPIGVHLVHSQYIGLPPAT